jgi:hypothetical protein
MSILNDIETTLENGDKIVQLKEEQEALIFDILIPGVTRVVTNQNLPVLLQRTLDNAIFPRLSKYKNREIVSVDCHAFTRSDTYGFMVALAKKVAEVPDLILVVENISDIYSDPLCEDPLYVENLLGHSWKNDVVYFDDKRIDRSKMTVILTGTPDQKEVLGSKYRTDGFAWIESLDEELKDLNDRIKKIG